jgi:hypothetical protein
MQTATEKLKARVLAKATTEHPFDMNTNHGDLEDIPTLMDDYGHGSDVSLRLVGINLDGMAILVDDLVLLLGTTSIAEFEAQASQSTAGAIFEEPPFMGAVL